MKKIILGLLMSSVSSAIGGGMGNGGHIYEMQFKNAGKQIVRILKDDRVTKHEAIKDINVYLLEMNLETIEIEVVEKKKGLKDKFGRRKCALNFPGRKLVQIHDKCWANFAGKPHLQLPFVLHEMLGLSGEEVDHYNISSRLAPSIESFITTLYEPIDLKSEAGVNLTAKNKSIYKIGKFTQQNISFYLGFEKKFGLRKFAYKNLDILCQHLGFRFYIDVESEISNYLIRTLEVKSGGLTLSETENVDKYINTVTCAK